ncbi:MAG: hypothetical protein RL062_183 [Bacteroidota bacterium]
MSGFRLKQNILCLWKFLSISIAFFLTSCSPNISSTSTFYKYQYRLNEIENSDIHLTPHVVDLCIDFDKIITGNSAWKRTKEEAILGAQFNALQVDSSVDVLVAPVFLITQESKQTGNNTTDQFKAEVIAFSGQYCQQYSLIEALKKSEKINISNALKMEMLDGHLNPWTQDPFIIGEIFSSQSKSSDVADSQLPKDQNVDEQFKSDNKLNAQLNSPELKADSTLSQENNSKDSTSLSFMENKLIPNDSLTKEVNPNHSFSNYPDSISAIPEKTLPTDHLKINSDAEKNNITLDEQVQRLYAQSIIRDSAEKIIKNGKQQMDFILHNDDYISRWMKENPSLKKQLIMFLKIQQNESEFIELKYKNKRTEAEDLNWGKTDYYLLELEYLNRNKLLFYSNFNLLRSKKLVEDCYLNANDSSKAIVKKYIELAENWLSEATIPLEVNSTDALMKNGLPIRKKINAEYFAAEIYYRAWEICQGKKRDFLSDTLNWNTFTNPLNDSAKWKEADSDQAYSIKNDHSAKFEEKQFPKGSYLDLMQIALHLPDTLKQPIFSTFPNTNIPEDFDFPTNIKYPSGLIYVVQVGAFRNKLDPAFYKRFAPVVKEAKGDGVFRYTAGFFPKYGSAQIALRQIKQIGFKDAFIVAIQDGVRVPIPAKGLRLR